MPCSVAYPCNLQALKAWHWVMLPAHFSRLATPFGDAHALLGTLITQHLHDTYTSRDQGTNLHVAALSTLRLRQCSTCGADQLLAVDHSW
jgi:hypothetical protein